MKYSQMFFIEIVEKLRETSGRNDKTKIIKEAAQGKPYFREFLMATYNPFIRYHIRKIPEYTPRHIGGENLESILKHDKLGLLAERKKTGIEAEKFLLHLLESVPKRDAEALELIIQRDLKAGFSISTINKAIPGLIPTYPCMLASQYNDKIIKEFEFPGLAQIKMDGLRANIHVHQEKGVEVFSRSGKDLGLGFLFEDLLTNKTIQRFGNVVLDGEIVVYDNNQKKFLARKKSNGIINSYAQGKITEENKNRYTPIFYIWDAIDYQHFTKIMPGDTKQHWDITYDRRFYLVLNILRDSENKHLNVVKNVEVSDIKEVEEFFAEAIENGEEGIILKSKKNIWRDCRPKDQIKFKMERECELFIQALAEGRGRFKGKLGAFVCESADGLLKVSVGSGLSEDQRETLYDEDLIGRVISIKFNEVIDHDGDSKKSLFLPIFIELREDKDTANTLEEIEEM